jgi:hypothetical protein
MKEAAKNLEFERAAALRDELYELKSLLAEDESLKPWERIKLLSACSACEHGHFDLPLCQFHHFHGFFGRDGCRFQELTCHAAESRAEGNAFGDVESVFDAAAGEDSHFRDGSFHAQIESAVGIPQPTKGGGEAAGEFIGGAVHFHL